ncbi:hypothetical protein [Enterococcus sp.]|uniref:hypothetical protein n=1 Tax=Enterococcus sp. TaxID=35783 RepID=UPI00289E5227|nr:hypothetical protein [Enterococcus sp.]
MDYDDIYQVESLLVSNDEEKYVNDLLKSGWKLISVAQYKDEYNEYGKYVLGADKETFEKRNLKMIEDEEVKKNGYPF